MSETGSTRPEAASAPPGARRLFLERRSYRQRRIADALRLMPVLALVFWMLPLIWPKSADQGEAMSTSGATLYVFGVWYLLIAICAILALRLGPVEDEGGSADTGEDRAGASPKRRGG